MSRHLCKTCKHDVQYSFGKGIGASPECICARVFGTVKQWWDKEPGYVRDEIKAALRRPARSGLHAKRRPGRWSFGYLPINYSLPCPSLAASAKRLAKAEITLQGDLIRVDRVWNERDAFVDVPVYEILESWTGPRAAEQYVAYRRAQLGLDLEAAA